MRKVLLAVGLLTIGYAGTSAIAADFYGYTPEPTPVTPLKDYSQIQQDVNRNKMDQLRIQMMQEELEQRRQQRQPRQIYYCRTPSGDYVACR